MRKLCGQHVEQGSGPAGSNEGRDNIFGCSSAGRIVDESDEARRPEKILTTILPGKKDIDEHNTLRHCQDRSWYLHRVTGRGVGQRPTSVAKKRKNILVVMFDCPCMTKAQTLLAPITVEAEFLAPFAVTYVARSLQCIGHLDVINKSDGAHSVTVHNKRKKVAAQAEIRSTPEENPHTEPQSNGHVKSAVKA